MPMDSLHAQSLNQEYYAWFLEKTFQSLSFKFCLSFSGENNLSFYQILCFTMDASMKCHIWWSYPIVVIAKSYFCFGLKCSFVKQLGWTQGSLALSCDTGQLSKGLCEASWRAQCDCEEVWLSLANEMEKETNTCWLWERWQETCSRQ